jgi:hypothetical protein
LTTFHEKSGFWEIDLLENVKTKTVIRKMKSQFARYGVPDVCMSDNGTQFVSGVSKVQQELEVSDNYIFSQTSSEQWSCRKRSPSSEMSHEESEEK